MNYNFILNMSETLFNINILSNTLEKCNIDNSQTNCYLFLTFFLERCQLVSNIIRVINPDIKNSLSYGIKYCLLNPQNYDKLVRKIKDFKNDFDKNELINELIKFIKNTIDERKLKNDFPSERISIIFNSFSTIKNTIDDLEGYGVDENEIYEYLQIGNNIDKKEELNLELNNIENNWVNYNKKSDIYVLLQSWINF